MPFKMTIHKEFKSPIEKMYVLKIFALSYLVLCSYQCDQKKIAKCLQKLPRNYFTRKIIDFDTFTKVA